MNKLFAILLAVCVFSVSVRAISEGDKAKNFAMGLAIGMGALDYMPDALPCVQNADPLIADVKGLFKEFESIFHLNFNKIAHLIQNTTVDFSTVMAQCKTLSAEGKAFFGNLSKHFTNSTLRHRGELNLGKNFVAVADDIKQGISTFKKGVQETDFLTSGAKFGDIVNIFVNGASNQAQNQNFLSLNKNISKIESLENKLKNLGIGFVFGSEILAQLPATFECVEDGGALIKTVKAIISELKAKKFRDALVSIELLYTNVTQTVPVCKQLATQLEAFATHVKQSLTNETQIHIGEEALINNIRQVNTDIHTAITSMKNATEQDFNNLGNALGDIFKLYEQFEEQAEQPKLYLRRAA